MLKWIFAGIGGILLGCLIVLIYVAFTSPSCEERGGTLHFSHFITQVTMVNNSPIVTQVPIYRCDGAISVEEYRQQQEQRPYE